VQQFPTLLPRAAPKDWADFGTGGCPQFLTNNGRSLSNYLSSTKRSFSFQFFNIPQTAITWRRLPSSYSIWQNGRFTPKPLATLNQANKQTPLLQPKRCATLQNFTAQSDSISPSSCR
jgi:hypothetical protein